jgi:hypothetical protein
MCCQPQPRMDAACKVATETIVAAIHLLRSDAAVLSTELRAGGYQDAALTNLQTLNDKVELTMKRLVDDWTQTETELIKLRKFFGEDPKRCPVEDFFVAVRNFVGAANSAKHDMSKNPKKWAALITQLASS